MAARPLLFYEVAGNSDIQFNDDVRQPLLQAAKIAQANDEYSSNDEILSEIRDPPNLECLKEEAIKAGYSGRGEMFSARDMTHLARKATDKYNVKLVKRSLLAPTQICKKTNTDGRKRKRGGVNKKEVMFSDSDDNLAIQPDDPSWALNIVQRLYLGHLIAVW